MSRKHKLAEEHAKSEGDNGNAETSFLAGYAACEQDAKKDVFDDIRSQLPGFHACPEWDEMYIWKGLPEMSACSCLEKKEKLYPYVKDIGTPAQEIGFRSSLCDSEFKTQPDSIELTKMCTCEATDNVDINNNCLECGKPYGK